ncbi:hypothetical protein LO762_14760 [Actinocorallia sp. API 0066]|uniref:hypothetical protein n=1 Tax=Actinocorallia sp. API 0066 TaxID=2896846 RepID=UPI001E51E301|nr:hypothetical protein [Actinocorallia sp. API 0066]MCD0450441.1 hypothetical protein [Actinocorallia sp. API 0066]
MNYTLHSVTPRTDSSDEDSSTNVTSHNGRAWLIVTAIVVPILVALCTSGALIAESKSNRELTKELEVIKQKNAEIEKKREVYFSFSEEVRICIRRTLPKESDEAEPGEPTAVDPESLPDDYVNTPDPAKLNREQCTRVEAKLDVLSYYASIEVMERSTKVWRAIDAVHQDKQTWGSVVPNYSHRYLRKVVNDLRFSICMEVSPAPDEQRCQINSDGFGPAPEIFP